MNIFGITFTQGARAAAAVKSTGAVETAKAAQAAQGMGVSPHPVMMCLCVAGAASFMTPIATSTNLMVMGPGGYAFSDYWRLGLPLMALYFVVAVLLVPLVWPF